MTPCPRGLAEAGGIRFAYRRFGNPAGLPLVLVQHFRGNMDNHDSAITADSRLTAFVLVGMVEVSSRLMDAKVTPGYHVGKGEDRGCFQYGCGRADAPSGRRSRSCPPEARLELPRASGRGVTGGASPGNATTDPLGGRQLTIVAPPGSSPPGRSTGWQPARARPLR